MYHTYYTSFFSFLFRHDHRSRSLITNHDISQQIWDRSARSGGGRFGSFVLATICERRCATMSRPVFSFVPLFLRASKLPAANKLAGPTASLLSSFSGSCAPFSASLLSLWCVLEFFTSESSFLTSFSGYPSTREQKK